MFKTFCQGAKVYSGFRYSLIVLVRRQMSSGTQFLSATYLMSSHSKQVQGSSDSLRESLIFPITVEWLSPTFYVAQVRCHQLMRRHVTDCLSFVISQGGKQILRNHSSSFSLTSPVRESGICRNLRWYLFLDPIA